MGCLVFMAVNWSILLSDTDTQIHSADVHMMIPALREKLFFQTTDHKN